LVTRCSSYWVKRVEPELSRTNSASERQNKRVRLSQRKNESGYETFRPTKIKGERQEVGTHEREKKGEKLRQKMTGRSMRRRIETLSGA